MSSNGNLYQLIGDTNVKLGEMTGKLDIFIQENRLSRAEMHTKMHALEDQIAADKEKSDERVRELEKFMWGLAGAATIVGPVIVFVVERLFK